MKFIQNAYVDRTGAYRKDGGLILGTQRIPSEHRLEYWQQANLEISLARLSESFNEPIVIEEALYVGRIPTHFGHFIMEGLPRLCDASVINIPIIGYITDGVLPEGKLPTSRETIMWFIDGITSETFFQIEDGQSYLVKKLHIPKLPIILSQSCSEPWRMTPMIEKLVIKARSENPDIDSDIENLYLKRNEEVHYNDNHYILSEPEMHISKQITMISYAKNLHGLMGSNSHLSIFGKTNATTNWERINNFMERIRNQLICDLVKTYNKF